MSADAERVLALGAVATAREIRAGRLGAEQAVALRVARMRQLDPGLGAVVVDLGDAALEGAREADRKLAAGEAPGPLHGVPFTAKEMIAVAGLPNTIGSWPLRERVARSDATVIARLRAAGAILVGTTNLSEMALWPESVNPVYGRTRNPHDPRRTAGGSSGGEAAAVAAGFSAFGIGSDGGGSLRIPAHHCGVFAHKPSSGLVPRTGHFPLGEDDRDFGLDDRCITLGPVSRDAADLLPLLRVLAGPDGRDPRMRDDVGLDEVDHEDWSGRTVLTLEDPRITLCRRASGAHREAVRRAAGVLAARGARVRAFDHPLIRKALTLWFAAIMRDDMAPLREIFGAGEPLHVGRELWRLVRGRRRHELPALLLCLLDRRLRPSGGRAPWLARIATLREDLEAALGRDGVLLMPAMPRTAGRHGRTLLHPFDFACTGLWNAVETCATAIPAGRGGDGLPIGIQAVAARGADAAAIAAARALEGRGFGAVTAR